VDYVLERARTRFSPEYDTTVQSLDLLYNEVRNISVIGPDGASVPAVSLIYNPGTDNGPIKAALIDTPVDDTRGELSSDSGLEPAALQRLTRDMR
jgi:hypothetical protein